MQLKDSPPEATFGRVGKFCLRLEGLFRKLPPKVKRDNTSFLQAILQVRRKYPSTEVFLDVCEDCSIFCKGSKKSQAAAEPAESGADDADGEPSGPAPVNWCDYTAETLAKVGNYMQKELWDDRLMTTISRWCNAPQKKSGWLRVRGHLRAVRRRQGHSRRARGSEP